jgi:hypothetical protein
VTVPVLPRSIRRTLVVAALAVATGASALSVGAHDATVIPQARPVLAWLSAVKAGNHQLKRKELPAVRVIRENDGWKVNEALT